MKKNVVLLFAALLITLFSGCNTIKDSTEDHSTDKGPVEAVRAAWRSGHAVYNIDEKAVTFRHYDSESGLEDYGFNGVVVSKTIEGDFVRIVAFVTEITTSPEGWATEGFEGFVTLFAANVYDGVNVDLVRLGTPGHPAPPAAPFKDLATAELVEVPAIEEGSAWKTYDQESASKIDDYLFTEIQGSWKSGHAEYHINGNVLDFRHYDNETGIENFGFIMKIASVSRNGNNLSMVASIDSITTSASWMTGTTEGYVNLFAANIIPGTNVDLIRIGTPGFMKDLPFTDVSSAKAAEMPAFGEGSRWLTYDLKM